MWCIVVVRTSPSWMPMKKGQLRNLRRKDVKNFDRCAKLNIQIFNVFERRSVCNFGDVGVLKGS